MARCTVRASLRVGLVALTLALSATVSQPVHAEESAANLIDEAEKLTSQARELANDGKLDGAIAALERALQLQEERVVPRLPEAMRPLFRLELTQDKLFLLGLHAKNGNFARAVELLEAELRFHESFTGDDKYADLVARWKAELPRLKANKLLAEVKRGVELYQQDRNSEALLVLQRVLPELDRSSDIDPEELVSANVIAARVMKGSLLYPEAEARYLRALDFAEKAWSRDAPQLVGILSDLGQLALQRGIHERGAKYLVRAHAIARAHSPESLPGTVKDLGLLLSKRHDHAQAIQVLNKAIALYSARSGAQADLGGLAARLYLASVQDDAGQFADADASYQKLGSELARLLAGQPALLGLKAVYLRSFAVHHLRQGHYDQAEKLMLEAIAVSTRVLSADSSAVVQQGCDLGEIYWAAGDLERSLGPIGRCFDSREVDIAQVLATGTEEQKRAFLGEYLVAFQKTMNAQRLGGNSNQKLNRLALTQVLRTKGRVLDAMTSGGLATRVNQSQATRETMQRLTAVRAQLAGLASSGMGSATDLKRLTDEAAGLESKLSDSDPDYRAAVRVVDVASVQAKLTRDDVLLEIVQYRPLDAHYRKAEPQLRYLAYVLHHEGEPQAVDLGPAAAIDEAAGKLRTALRSPEKPALPAARALYDLVMKPVRAALGEQTHVFVAPDGALNAVPFAALASGDAFLLEQLEFTYLTSGRDLLRFGAVPAATGPIVAFANPDFGSSDTRVTSGATKLSRVSFPPLPGTQAEADALKKLFPDATVHTGAEASEAELKKVSRPFALHLATHGYFLPVQSLSNLAGPNGNALDSGTASARLAVAENPLVRSGLAFAGATGLRGGGGEDGVLTALEASSLDLSGTQLVVLSACQTAEGEVTQGDGVYGLRRAFTVGGAESLVMSLWSVDDDATSYLMRGYYRRLREGQGRSAALRDVQRVLAHQTATQHPYYWAAFIPSGNPGPITLPSSSSGSSSNSGSAASSSGSSEPSSSFSSDSDDWPTATPSLSGSLGLVQLGIEPTDGRPAIRGWQGYASIDMSPLSGSLEDSGGNKARGFAVYDRLGLNLGLLNVSGDSLVTLGWEYSLLFGYRARLIGLFGGLRYGSNTIAASADGGPKATGSFFPLAGRLELPWFWESRISALGYYGGLLDRRQVTGVDVRVPIGDPGIWIQVGYSRSAGKPEQNDHAIMIPISLGFAGD